MYNRLKKVAAAAAETTDAYATQLDDRNAKDKLAVDGLNNTDKLLDKVRGNEDCIDTTEVQLDEGREKLAEAPLTQKQLNDAGKKHRNDTPDNIPVSPLAMLNAAQEAEHAKAYAEAEKDTIKDDAFWDAYAAEGDEYEVGESQLQNIEDRFGKLSTDVNEVAKQDNIREMVTASLRDADQMLLHIYVKAASEGRAVTAQEQAIVDGVNEAKGEMLRIKIASALRTGYVEKIAQMLPPAAPMTPDPVAPAAPAQPDISGRIDKLKRLLDQTPVTSPDHDRIQHELEVLIEQGRGQVEPKPAAMVPPIQRTL